MLQRRRDRQRDDDFANMILAARAPHTDDGGKSLLDMIRRKHDLLEPQEEVTIETIRKDIEMARRMFGR